MVMKAERNNEIVELRKQKKTYQEISTEFGITRERVRQILMATEPDLCGPIFRQKSKTKKAILRECGYRKCFMCRNIYPSTIEYFYQATNGMSLVNYCKRCNTVRHREYLNKNWEREQQYRCEYRLKNKERIDGYISKWQKANPDKMAEYAKRTYENRKDNPKYKIRGSIVWGMRQSLKDGKNGRSWESLVGYTLDDLMDCLESQFTKGMTWDNYGFRGWHIDHIRPVNDFNFETCDDSEFKECWSLWNLQPLWAEDNLRKHSKCEAPPLPLIS